MNLPNWEELLRHFASKIHPDNPLALETFKNKSSAKGLPEILSLIETEFNQLWLTSPEYSTQRKIYQDSVRAGVSPFKLELSALVSAAEKSIEVPHLLDELSCLTNVAKRSVAGVITTNYDLLPEEVFKGYTTFIGQEQLLFGETQGICEIYKIHGCCTQPESIIINAKDYQQFERKNAYLAAKLLTVFVEHPIIFMGYSLSDPNVQSILEAIIGCLSEKNLRILKQRMIFVEYTDAVGEDPEITEHSVNFEAGPRSITMTKITLNDFLPFYSELVAQKYQYNPKLLRQLKRDIYQLVATNEPVERFQITDIEDDEGLDNVGVLAGVGVHGDAQGGERGHHIPDPSDLFCDVVLDNKKFDLRSLVEGALVKLQTRHSHSLPIHKYVSAYRKEFHAEPPAKLIADCKHSVDELFSKSLQDQRSAHPISSIAELSQQASTNEKWIELFPRVQNPSESIAELETFLKEHITSNPEVLHAGKSGDKTNLKRLIRIYDWLKYGQK